MVLALESKQLWSDRRRLRVLTLCLLGEGLILDRNWIPAPWGHLGFLHIDLRVKGEGRSTLLNAPSSASSLKLLSSEVLGSSEPEVSMADTDTDTFRVVF